MVGKEGITAHYLTIISLCVAHKNSNSSLKSFRYRHVHLVLGQFMLTLLVSLEEYLTQLKPNITVCVHVLLKQFSFVISCNQLYGPSWRHVV